MNLTGKAERVSLQCAVWQAFKKNVATDATEVVNLFIVNRIMSCSIYSFCFPLLRSVLKEDINNLQRQLLEEKNKTQKQKQDFVSFCKIYPVHLLYSVHICTEGPHQPMATSY